MSKVRKTLSDRKLTLGSLQNDSQKQHNVHQQLLLNQELSIVKSARNYKQLKLQVQSMSQLLGYVAAGLITVGSLVSVGGLLDAVRNFKPFILLIPLAIMPSDAYFSGSSKFEIYINVLMLVGGILFIF